MKMMLQIYTNPSSINSAYDIPIKYMDEVEWNNYTDTIKLLESISNIE